MNPVHKGDVYSLKFLFEDSSDNPISQNALRFLQFGVGYEPYKFIQKVS